MKAIRNYEGIVLRARPGREGGRSLLVFTREAGLLRLSVPHSVLSRYGPGALLPFSLLRLSAMSYDEYAVARQYEGRPLFDTMSLSYDEMKQWAYVAELTLQLFPIGQPDLPAYEVLLAAATAAAAKNKMLTAFTAAVQLLAAAGFDPSREETEREAGLAPDAAVLLAAFRHYRWQGPFPVPVTRLGFHACAAYLDRFIVKYCDFLMNTKGAFTEVDGG